MKKNHSAFSLVELSIVILIIGIVVAGITQSSRLVTQFKINIARSQTQSAPVTSIPNLTSWYETTSDKSFMSSEAEDGLSVSKWYDISQQSGIKNHASQSTTANKPTYKIEPQTSLPMLLFSGATSGSQDFLNLPDGTIPYGNSSYTVFIVFKVSAEGIMLGAGTNAVADQYNAFAVVSGSGNQLANSWYSANDFTSVAGAVGLNKFYVVAFTYDNTIGKRIYSNGTAVNAYGTSNTLVSITSRNGDSVYNYIGCSNASASNVSSNWWTNGYLGEIIIYDRILKDEERKSVEKYIGKKWGITVS